MVGTQDGDFKWWILVSAMDMLTQQVANKYIRFGYNLVMGLLIDSVNTGLAAHHFLNGSVFSLHRALKPPP